MNPSVSEKRSVIVGLVVTDRLASVERLLVSLRPVAQDPDVHVVLLDNGTQPSALLDLVVAENKQASGWRWLVSTARPREPLHETRQQLSHWIVSLAQKWDLQQPIVWIVDDDLTFERLRLVGGYLDRQNVALQRIAQVRELSARGSCDLLVSGFTGDAPVRPNSVISCQLRDLREELARLSTLGLQDGYPCASVDPTIYRGDYYYSHSEERSQRWVQPYPWLVRAEGAEDVEGQLISILIEAQGIELGRGVFRPLLEERDSDFLHVVDSKAPNRGGNAVFFGLEPLLAHRYPAFQVGDGYSRRSDMIGSTLLARETVYRVAEGNLSLYHDRRGQCAISAHPREWQREFAGVMLGRLVMQGVPEKISIDHYLASIARNRVCRIQMDASRIIAEVEIILEELDQPDACWWRSEQCREQVEPLRTSLLRIQKAFRDAHHHHLFDNLVTHDFLDRVTKAYKSLL